MAKKLGFGRSLSYDIIKQGYKDFDIDITPLKVALAESRKTRAI